MYLAGGLTFFLQRAGGLFTNIMIILETPSPISLFDVFNIQLSF